MQVTFSPRLQTGADIIERWLLLVSQYLLCGTLLAAPFLFLAPAPIAVGFTKSFVLTIGTLLTLIIFSLFLLRAGMVRLVGLVVLLPLWGMVLVSVVSALLSGDRFDALIGDNFSIHTVGFLALLALVTTATAIVLDSKSVITKFFVGFCGAAMLVEFWHVARFFFGADFLSFGIFTSPTSSLLGSFNDVALFAGLVVILGLVALLQLPLRGLSLGVVAALMVFSLSILAVVNFFLVWLVVGFFSLLSLLYALTRDRLLSTTVASGVSLSRPVIIVLGVVCGVSALFVVAGTYLGGILSDKVGVQYIEVRPSLTTTIDIAGATYKSEGALLGIGPNRFEDAWRLHKNPAINETVFWSTAFTAGSGYIPTLFVTTGVLGGVVMLLFLASVMYIGYRTLVFSASGDPFWYFVGTVSLTGAVYVWGMSVVYVPGVTLLIIGASLTGVLLVAHSQLALGGVVSLSFSDSRPRVFVLIGMVMLLIAVSVGAMFVLSKQYVAHVISARAIAAGADEAQLDQVLDRASLLSGSDTYLAERVSLRLATLNRLLSNPSPTADDQRLFRDAAETALRLSGMMIAWDSTNPTNHALLGSTYGILALAGVENAMNMSSASLNAARAVDPQNPEYALIDAQIAARSGNTEKARTALADALSKKPNYVDALFLLSQVEVGAGNTDVAVTAARSIVSIESQNPARHFQLGSLLFSTKDYDGAYLALTNAISLDQNFANARYLLALTYLQKGDRDSALKELRTVQTTNSENSELATLIGKIESGEVSMPELGINAPVNETSVSVDDSGVATSETSPDTDLLVPVNRTNDQDQPVEERAGSESEEEAP